MIAAAMASAAISCCSSAAKPVHANAAATNTAATVRFTHVLGFAMLIDAPNMQCAPIDGERHVVPGVGQVVYALWLVLATGATRVLP